MGGLVLSVWIWQSNIIPELMAQAHSLDTVAALLAGMLFTSILTTAPAIVSLVELSETVPALQLALVGGIGAALGDLMIFHFVRSPVTTYILRAAFHPNVRRMRELFSRGSLHWIAPMLGAIVIASPLPDEIGLFLMGISEFRPLQIAPFLFAANATGIYLIALAAQSF